MLRLVSTLVMFGLGFIGSATAFAQSSLTIVAFGDSTTATRNTVRQVYADRLPVLLKANGIEANVINSGVGGSHTGRLKDNDRHRRRHALDRLDDSVRDRKPDVVVVQFGWNDSWVDSNKNGGISRIPVENYLDNLKHIVTALNSDGARVILMTPNRPKTSLDAWRIERTKQYVEAVRTLAAAESVPLVDVWAEYERIDAIKDQSLNDLLLDDVHPNDRGHKLVAQLLSETIARLQGSSNDQLTVSASERAIQERKAKTPKHNILFIAIDDLRPKLGCYGHKFVKSPNIDRLASQGVLFQRAYCQQPLCNPSRTSLMTGMRPESIGVLGNHVYFRNRFPDVSTLPQHFKKNGYTSIGIGKMYHGPFSEDAVCSKWDRLDDPPSWSEPAIRFGPRYYFTDKGMAAARKVYDSRNPDADHDAWQNALLFGPMTEAPDVSDDSLYDGKVGDAAIAKLRELNQKDRPFFLGVGFIKPHTPYIAPKKYWDMYVPKEIPLAENPKFPESAPQIAFHSSGEIRRYTDQPKREPFTEANRRNLKHGYLACISHVDAQVGRVLDELERLGIADNTIVVLWGDHGYHLGEQNIWGKHTTFENAARVPLIVRVPNAKGNGEQTDALVELVDLYPTLVDAAGLPFPDHLEGVSFRAVLDQPEREWKTAAFTDQPAKGNWDRGGDVVGRSMKTDQHRYTAWIERATGKVVARQLYDHQADPLETKNLAASADYGELVGSLQKKLTAGWRGAFGEAKGFVAENTVANSNPSEPDLGTGFESFPAGAFTRVDDASGTWEAAKGHAVIHAEHARSGNQSLRLPGGKDRQVVWTLAKSGAKRDSLSFWFERWTSRKPWDLRVEGVVDDKWKTLHHDTSRAVTGSFRNHLSLKLGDMTPEKIRFTCTAPKNSGIMIDDLELLESKPMSLSEVLVRQKVHPALIGKSENAVLNVVVNVEGTIGKAPRVEAMKLISTGTDDLGDVESAQVFYTGNQQAFSDTAAFGERVNMVSEWTVLGRQQLEPGENNFWLSYRLKPTASLDRKVDAGCISIRIDGKDVEISKPSPTGAKRIGFALRQRGQGGVNTTRIPGLSTTNAGSLIAVYDNRNRRGGDLPGDIDVGMSRSTDGGQTWEPMRVIMDMGNDPKWNYDGIGDPAVLVDRVNGTIWVAATWSHGNRSWRGSGPGMTPEETGQLMLVKSEDDGKAWSKPINITQQIKDPKWRFVLQGPGRGITMQDGTLVFAAQFRGKNEEPVNGKPFSTLIYSIDRGQTWKIGTGVKIDTTEAQLVELADGSIMINCRDNRGGSRSIYTTRDLGKTWQEHPTTRSALPEPVCMASLLRVSTESHGPLLFFSNPPQRGGRRHMTIKVSNDEGTTWPRRWHTLVDERFTAYSCMTPIGDDKLGLVYEAPGELYFVRYSVDELLKEAASDKRETENQ